MSCDSDEKCDYIIVSWSDNLVAVKYNENEGKFIHKKNMHFELGGPEDQNLLYHSTWAKIIGPKRLFLNSRGIYHGSKPLFYGTVQINEE